MKKILIGTMLAICFCTGTIVQATTAYPSEGGQWNYGYTVLGAYSDYFHSSKKHGSTVVNSSTGVKNDATANAGYWSQAFLQTTYSGCSFYYSLR
jgi:lactococcin 972 family bacteriocin